MSEIAAKALPADLAYESKFQGLTRLGFLARGLLYILIAALVTLTGRTEDLTGALEVVGRGFGWWLLAFLAAGLGAYGLWRLGDAAFGMESGRHSGKAIRKRIVAAGIGAVYLGLAYKAARMAIIGRSDAPDAADQAKAVLDLPGGELMLMAAGIGMAIAAGAQVRKAYKCSFLDPLSEEACAPPVKWLGRIGYAARGVIFAGVAILLWRAGINSSPGQAGGTEQAMDMLQGPLEYAVALGLFLFGTFSIIEARYRRIHRPPVHEMADKVREKVQSA